MEVILSSSNHLQMQHVPALVEHLCTCPALIFLDLSDNDVSVEGICRLTICILRNHKLTDVRFDHEPSACVGHDAWRSEGLPVLPAEVIRGEWRGVLKCLRELPGSHLLEVFEFVFAVMHFLLYPRSNSDFKNRKFKKNLSGSSLPPLLPSLIAAACLTQ